MVFLRIPMDDTNPARQISVLTGKLRVNGIWIAISTSSFISMVLSQAYYKMGRWKNKKLTQI